jgi:hypothetical protein
MTRRLFSFVFWATFAFVAASFLVAVLPAMMK